MNIFILDEDPNVCARYHVDKHVGKMGMELTQMLCTVMRERCDIDYGYKSTYINHPCTKWVGESYANFLWTRKLAYCLFKEHTYRYGSIHAAQAVLEDIFEWIPEIEDTLPKFGPFPLVIDGKRYPGMTPFYKAVSARFKKYDPITAYRLYYYYVKRRLHEWTGRPTPPFMLDHVGGIAKLYQLHFELMGGGYNEPRYEG